MGAGCPLEAPKPVASPDCASSQPAGNRHEIRRLINVMKDRKPACGTTQLFDSAKRLGPDSARAPGDILKQSRIVSIQAEGCIAAISRGCQADISRLQSRCEPPQVRCIECRQSAPISGRALLRRPGDHRRRHLHALEPRGGECARPERCQDSPREARVSQFARSRQSLACPPAGCQVRPTDQAAVPSVSSGVDLMAVSVPTLHRGL